MSGVKHHNITKPVIKKGQLDDSFKIQPLPAPSGNYPYHLSFPVSEGYPSKTFAFNLVGDTGGMKSPKFQQQIAEELGKQTADHRSPSQFLYHLGDIVYHYGELEQYEKQFFTPYSHFPGPIYAIAGNHDADVNPSSAVPYKSLDAFTSVFCDVRPADHYFSKNVTRKNQCQPNVYWTLNTEMATIIGLYSNVPKFGYIDEKQQEWFVKELIRAREMKEEKAIIVCVHHSPYSADTNHGSSLAMINVLESCFKEAGVLPDIVFSGHVHNYQRFSKKYDSGKTVPFIVAGSGGFDELHVLASINDAGFTSEDPHFEKVRLENFSLYQHGFLKVILKKTADEFLLTCEYYTMVHEDEKDLPATLFDFITLDLKRNREIQSVFSNEA